MTRLLPPLLLAAVVLANLPSAQAQDYPSKPIPLIAPWPAGGGGLAGTE